MLTALGAQRPSSAGNAKALLRHGLRAHGAEPLRGPPAHVRVGRRARDGRGQLRAPRRGAASGCKHARVVFVFAARAGFSHPLETRRRARGARPRRPRAGRRGAARRAAPRRRHGPRRAPALRARARGRAPALRRGGDQGPGRRRRRHGGRPPRRVDEARRAGPRAAEDAARARRVARGAPFAPTTARRSRRRRSSAIPSTSTVLVEHARAGDAVARALARRR